MKINNISEILTNIDWEKNISSSSEAGIDKDLDYLCKVISIISIQLEFIEEGNSSICFIREMQFSLHQSAALIGIGLYKASVCSLRTFVESFLYYTYFRSHPYELNTLYNNDKYYISKNEILSYHKMHTPGYIHRSGAVGFENKLNKWYSKSSAIVHGQIPGEWNTHHSVLDVKFSKKLFNKSIENFKDSVEVVFISLISIIDDECWQSFTFELKEMITKNIEKKKLILIDRTIF